MSIHSHSFIQFFNANFTMTVNLKVIFAFSRFDFFLNFFWLELKRCFQSI